MALTDKLTAIADAIREKTGGTAKLSLDDMPPAIRGIKSNPVLQSKTVSPTTSKQTVKPDTGYDGLSDVTVNAMASGAMSDISVSSSGVITSQIGTSGYLASGTKKTKSLTTQAAKTVTPTTSNQTAVASGRYTTGAVTVKGDSNLVAGNIKKGTSIFGVTGSYEGSGGGGGTNVETCTVTIQVPYSYNANSTIEKYSPIARSIHYMNEDGEYVSEVFYGKQTAGSAYLTITLPKNSFFSYQGCDTGYHIPTETYSEVFNSFLQYDNYGYGVIIGSGNITFEERDSKAEGEIPEM